MLYLGYVGFSITFSFAIAALIEGKVDGLGALGAALDLAAWSFLTAGPLSGLGGPTTNLDGVVGGSGIQSRTHLSCRGSQTQHFFIRLRSLKNETHKGMDRASGNNNVF